MPRTFSSVEEGLALVEADGHGWFNVVGDDGFVVGMVGVAEVSYLIRSGKKFDLDAIPDKVVGLTGDLAGVRLPFTPGIDTGLFKPVRDLSGMRFPRRGRGLKRHRYDDG